MSSIYKHHDDEGNIQRVEHTLKDLYHDIEHTFRHYIDMFKHHRYGGKADNQLNLFEPFNTFSPIIDVNQRKDEFIVHAELPGVPKENVNVEIVGDRRLVISGETHKEGKRKIGNGVITERCHGNFYHQNIILKRSINLPADIDKNKVQAHINNGVLEVKLPLSGKSGMITAIEIH
ncbi:8061_t:CDS:2 [Ambispora gerdemannii]|uniref:8061_t:CDS:1 n=1 Tax=Ambispora gerdemannii TaxID=144530 RepID=A0A9N9BW99_9GLOM|nr:8061_t:CDS:2 [Ambispora gerdemannii]